MSLWASGYIDHCLGSGGSSFYQQVDPQKLISGVMVGLEFACLFTDTIFDLLTLFREEAGPSM